MHTKTCATDDQSSMMRQGVTDAAPCNTGNYAVVLVFLKGNYYRESH